MSEGFEAAGFNSLMDKLGRLKALAQRRVITAAARTAMEPVLEEAKATVPRDSGELAEGLYLSTSRKAAGDAVAQVGIKVRGRGKSYWHLVEFGSSKKGARPYLRPAFRKNVSSVVETFREEMAENIQRALKRQEAKSFSGQAGRAAKKLSKKASRFSRRAVRAGKRAVRTFKRRRR